MENSIEEDIKIALDKFSDNKDSNSAVLIVEQFILGNYVLVGGRKDIVKNSLRYILSDYKRALKENELLRKDIEGWKKYCEEIEEEQTEMSNRNCELEFEIEKLQKENEKLKQDRNNNYQMIALAQNEVLGYIQGYEDGKKLKKSAVAFAVENQEYYLIRKEIEHYKEYIEKLKKENEELKNKLLDTLEGQKVIKEETPQYIKENYISKEKIEDKVRELECYIQENSDDQGYWGNRNPDVIYGQIEILQELIEEREEK